MQHDYDVANQDGALFRADMNNALQAGQTNNSGGSAPATTYPYQFWADTSANLLKMRNGANNAWVTIGLLGAANFGHLMPGSIVFHAKSAVPAGFLKANGGAVSRSTYSDLFAEIGTTFGSGDGSLTFNLPDLRGEFLRGWDDSRGVDSGRGFGTLQGFATEVHRHWRNTSHSAEFAYTDRANNAEDAQGRAGVRTYDSLGSQTDNQSTGTSATETRPRNIALLPCIKY